MNRRNFLTLGGKAGLVVGSTAMIIPVANLMAIPSRDLILLGKDSVNYMCLSTGRVYKGYGHIVEKPDGAMLQDCVGIIKLPDGVPEDNHWSIFDNDLFVMQNNIKRYME